MIELKKLSIKYNKNYLIKNFSLKLTQGQKVVITGPSGCGKSSIIKSILGFTDQKTGTIFVNKQKITSNTIQTIRNLCGYVPQNTNIYTGKVTDLINTIFSYKNNHHLKNDQTEINKLFNIFKLPQTTLHKDFTTLSGGEKQRVVLATTVLLKRPVFLLDEPTSALDKALKKTIADFFLNNKNYTAIIISHDHEWFKKNKCEIIYLQEK